MKKLLITFGCSWTYGVGLNYIDGMSKSEYNSGSRNNAVIANELSFRGLISKKLNFDNVNFSVGGSSNQKQFRLAKEFFFSNTFNDLKSKYKEIVVLWGITSTARNELYNLNKKEYDSFFYYNPIERYNKSRGEDWPVYSDFVNKTYQKLKDNINEELKKFKFTIDKESDPNWPFPANFVLFSYDHNIALHELILEIKMFNSFFSQQKIKCLWFDTFNHHDYETNLNPIEKEITGCDTPLENFLLINNHPRDLLSLMLVKNNSYVDDARYHLSTWDLDNDKLSMGIEKKLLNPYSYHPTAFGHREMADMLSSEIEKLLQG